jgi:hypothetical protein
MSAQNVQASDALTQLGQAWQSAHDDQVADNNNQGQQMEISGAALQGQAGMMLQNVGQQVIACAQTSGTQMGGIGTAHTQSYVTLNNADEEGSNAVAQVMSNLA